MIDIARRRAIIIGGALAAVVAIVLAVVLLGGGSDDSAIADDAAHLVPSDALVYLHLSTDPGRGGTENALKLAQSFPSWTKLRDGIIARLTLGGSGEEVRPWIGNEAGLALLGSANGTAGSLIVIDVRDEKKATAFVVRRGAKTGPSSRYNGVEIRRFGAVTAAFADRHLLLGQPATVRSAIDLAQGRRDGLDRQADFMRVRKTLPPDRVADVYATSAGLRRIVAPAGGVLGILGTLLDRPGLKATALSVRAAAPGARLTVHSIADAPKNSAAFVPFEPKLLDAVPKSALALINVRGIDRAVGRLLQAAGSGGLAGLTGVLTQALGVKGTAEVTAGLLEVLRGETALSILPGVPAPTLVLIARTTDEAKTRAAVTRLQPALKKLLRGGAVRSSTVAGKRVTVVRAGGRDVVLIGVFDGKLVLTTASAGIVAAAKPDGGLGGAPLFKSTLANPGKTVTSLVFLDFSQLLDLGEKTGLNDSRAYLAVKNDLTKVKAIGSRSTGTGGQSTAEIKLSIP